MALNLGATLRDAVDGPAGLDDLVGEDPADVDLPALSARIRHRRRVRAAGRSALGMAAAGAIALVTVDGGLGGRGAETYRDGAPAPLSASDESLCGQDVAAMPTTDSARLVAPTYAVVSDGSGNVGIAGDATSLGTLVGRSLTATLVQDDVAAVADAGHVVLTAGTTVVAVGAVQQSTTVTALGLPRTVTGATAAYSGISADLAPCPTPDGTPGSVPAGTYTVQYLVTDAQAPGTDQVAAPQRSSAGPWLVTLLEAPPPVTLPDGYPSGEVPVVSGTLLTAATSADTDGWTVHVAVDGDDALTRAKAALRSADADVSDGGLTVLAPADAVPPASGSTATTPDDLAALQAERDAARSEADDAQRAYDELQSAQADSETMAWAARQLQAATSTLEETELRVAAAQAVAEAQQQLDDARAKAAASQAESYTIVGPTSLQATTSAWSVVVTQSATGGRTVLTYTLTRR